MSSIFRLDAVAGALRHVSTDLVREIFAPLPDPNPLMRYEVALGEGSKAVTRLLQNPDFLALAAPAVITHCISAVGRPLEDFVDTHRGRHPDLELADIVSACEGQTSEGQRRTLEAAARLSELWKWTALTPMGLSSAALVWGDGAWQEQILNMLARGAAFQRSSGGTADPVLLTTLRSEKYDEALRWAADRCFSSAVTAYPNGDNRFLEGKIPLQFLNLPPHRVPLDLSMEWAKQLPANALLVFPPQGLLASGDTLEEWLYQALFAADRHKDVGIAMLSGAICLHGEQPHLWLGSKNIQKTASLATLLTGTPWSDARKIRVAGGTLYRLPGRVPGGPASLTLFEYPLLLRIHSLIRTYQPLLQQVPGLSQREQEQVLCDLLVHAERLPLDMIQALQKDSFFTGSPVIPSPDWMEVPLDPVAWSARLDRNPSSSSKLHSYLKSLPYGQATSIGTRSAQQDAVWFQDRNLPGGLQWVAATADGHDAGFHGRRASLAALAGLKQYMTELIPASPVLTAPELIPLLRQITKKIEAKLCESQHGGTTLVAVFHLGPSVVIMHVGDSRAYRKPSGSFLEQSTEDHHWLGNIHQYGLALTRTLGDTLNKKLAQGQITADPDFKEVSATPGDVFLLCTDGLSVLDHLTIEDQLNLSQLSPRENAEQLVEAARLAWRRYGQADNMTALVIKT